jgi:hypothetical protein
MDEKHREIAEDLFNKFSMSMTQTGNVVPIYVIILADDTVYPIMVDIPVEFREYSTIALNLANQYNAYAMMLICEQYMVSKKIGDSDLSSLLSGKIKASEHPDREEYLILAYMDENGNSESLIGKIERDLMGTPFTRESKWLKDTVVSVMMPWK